MPVACAGAGEQHPRVVVLGVGEPGASAHPGVHRERGLEVAFCLVPALRRRREDAEVAGDRASDPLGPVGGVERRPGKEQRVEDGGRVGVVQERRRSRRAGSCRRATPDRRAGPSKSSRARSSSSRCASSMPPEPRVEMSEDAAEDRARRLLRRPARGSPARPPRGRRGSRTACTAGAGRRGSPAPAARARRAQAHWG